MRESTRSELRSLLLIWAAAGLVALVGYLIALAVTIYGFVRVFTSDSLLLSTIPMVAGTALQLVLVTLLIGIRDRFEGRCWDLIVAEAGAVVIDETGAHVLTKQIDGDGNLLADVRARRSRRFSRRLRALIEQAWPDRAGR